MKDNPTEENKNELTDEQIASLAKERVDKLIKQFRATSHEILDEDSGLTTMQKMVLILRAAGYIGTTTMFRFASMSDGVIRHLLTEESKPHYELKEDAR